VKVHHVQVFVPTAKEPIVQVPARTAIATRVRVNVPNVLSAWVLARQDFLKFVPEHAPTAQEHALAIRSFFLVVARGFAINVQGNVPVLVLH
jgi:hypothetical protein